jgi:hypothetical protein
MPESLFSLSNLSIKHRLPLLIRGLLLGVTTASTWAGYRGGREAALEVGHERLIKRLVSLSQQWAVNLTNQTLTAPNDQAIKALLGFPSAATRSGAAAILRQFAATQDPNDLQVELWDADHSLALACPDGSPPQPADLRFEFDQFAAEPLETAQAIRKEKDPGSVLELDTCPRTVQEHRGTSRTESSLRQGTTLRISLLATVEGLEVAA